MDAMEFEETPNTCMTTTHVKINLGRL